MANKAHSAVVRRLHERYGTGCVNLNGYDLHVGDLFIEVETSATLVEGLQRLQFAAGRRYIAVTNREALPDALALTATTGIGVMDPWGNVVREAAESSGPALAGHRATEPAFAETTAVG
jgi:hypothetical protein